MLVSLRKNQRGDDCMLAPCRKFQPDLLITACAVLLVATGWAQSSGTSSSQGSAATSTSTSVPKARKKRPAGTLPASDRLDINAASKKQLTALSGIDDAIADKIIAGRPYRTKRD